MKITGSLIVCSLAALFTAGTLLVDPDPLRRAPIVTPAVAGAPPQISIEQYTFSAVTASPGATVAVVDGDDVEHTVTASDRSFDSGVIPAGGSGAFVAPLTPGVYTFACVIHPSMVGRLTVAG